MCGIIGYKGPQNAVTVILDGLRRLEYRGYDSAGLALVQNNEFLVKRAQGKLSNLEKKFLNEPVSGHLGSGHTRWATHGKPSEINAHPHLARDVAVVHNGIIENYQEIKKDLQAQGVTFNSETDTECAAHLIQHHLDSGTCALPEAVRRTLSRIKGSYALVVLDRRQPDMLIGARKDSPLVLGIGQSPGEFFLASDIPAFLSYSKQVVFLHDGDMVIIEKNNYAIVNLAGQAVERKQEVVSWTPAMAEKGGYAHFMQKEIFEQPRALTDTMAGCIKTGGDEVVLSDLEALQPSLQPAKRLLLLACGTSYHAALVGKFMIEALAHLPVEVDFASEFRYRDPLIGKDDVVMAISQSGETADTLAALREAKAKGATTLAICNVLGSTITRESQGVVYTHAGPEIGVASTKAFTAQLLALYMFAIYLGRLRQIITKNDIRLFSKELGLLPGLVQSALSQEPKVRQIAEKFFQVRDFLFLGRGPCYPIALEGALKLKEISYIHAEGYAAGEMKHGPIALIDDNLPVVVLANQNQVLEKIISNMQEVRARAGKVIVVAEADNNSAHEMADESISIPAVSPFLAPIVMSIPLQLLAYHIAVLRGTDVDQPRNLAKSVTVE
jgi:glucosamine--fructose-6-phosphate aminotransferase (isomerizing)